MEFKVGDTVKAINEASEGKITRFSNDLVFVEIEDFEFPFKPNELIKVENTFNELFHKYEKHAPPKEGIEINTKKKSLTKREQIEELGKVRGKRNSRGILEFDLHIHDLLVTHNNMHPGEMLDYQKEYAINCIEEALKTREGSIIFIHGIGKGILKSELLKIFRDYNFNFEDASRREYGIGATEVILR